MANNINRPSILEDENLDIWKQTILESLDHAPKHFDKLAMEFGFEKGPFEGHEEYHKLLEIVSQMETRSKYIKPKLKISVATIEGRYVYPIYRADQEGQLVKEGVLSKEVHVNNLREIAREIGLKTDNDLLPSGRERF